MPVKIVTGPSDPENGEISQHDLYRIIEDFQDFVNLQSGFQRPVNKINNIYVPMNIIREFVKDLPDDDDDYINIQFGLTLPTQKSCADDFKTDISNQLTVVINRAKKIDNRIVDKTNINNIILTSGFKTNEKPIDGPSCCGNPGSGDS